MCVLACARLRTLFLLNAIQVLQVKVTQYEASDLTRPAVHCHCQPEWEANLNSPSGNLTVFVWPRWIFSLLHYWKGRIHSRCAVQCQRARQLRLKKPTASPWRGELGVKVIWGERRAEHGISAYPPNANAMTPVPWARPLRHKLVQWKHPWLANLLMPMQTTFSDRTCQKPLPNSPGLRIS